VYCVWGDKCGVVGYFVWETGLCFQGIVCGVTGVEL